MDRISATAILSLAISFSMMMLDYPRISIMLNILVIALVLSIAIRSGDRNG